MFCHSDSSFQILLRINCLQPDKQTTSYGASLIQEMVLLEVSLHAFLFLVLFYRVYHEKRLKTDLITGNFGYNVRCKTPSILPFGRLSVASHAVALCPLWGFATA